MNEKKIYRVSMSFNEKQHEALKDKALIEGDSTLAGFTKRKLLTALEIQSCQIV